MTDETKSSARIDAKMQDQAEVKGNKPAGTAARSPNDWLNRFDAWVNSHPVRPGINLDDSREGIYAGRGDSH